MNKEQFKNLSVDSIDNIYLKALWFQSHNQWDKAHQLVQYEEDKIAYWIHALLHREENDISNSNYWYVKAGKQIPNNSIQEEWKEIFEQINHLL